jgi:hypothetical protein
MIRFRYRTQVCQIRTLNNSIHRLLSSYTVTVTSTNLPSLSHTGLSGVAATKKQKLLQAHCNPYNLICIHCNTLPIPLECIGQYACTDP